MNNVKIKLFSTVCKSFEDIEENVNSFCKNVNVIDIKQFDTRIMVIYGD